jgi:hypothetical protein
LSLINVKRLFDYHLVEPAAYEKLLEKYTDDPKLFLKLETRVFESELDIKLTSTR